MNAPARKDADNLKILEGLRPEYDRLKASRIRTEAEVERHAEEHERAKAEAMELLGTDDEARIRAMIEEGRAANTRDVDAFSQALQDVKAELTRIEQGVA